MRKTFFTSLALLAALAFSAVTVQADDYDNHIAKIWEVQTVHDVMPVIMQDAKIEAPATTATFFMNATLTQGKNQRVFRHFRTIADSGGRRI